MHTVTLTLTDSEARTVIASLDRICMQSDGCRELYEWLTELDISKQGHHYSPAAKAVESSRP